MAYTNSIGIIQNLKYFFDEAEKDLHEQMVDSGLKTVQMLVNDTSLDFMTEENAETLLRMTEGKLHITSFWAGWSDPNIWDFLDRAILVRAGPRSISGNVA